MIVKVWANIHIIIFILSIVLVIFVEPLGKRWGNKLRELDYKEIGSSPIEMLGFLLFGILSICFMLIFFPTSFLLASSLMFISEHK